MNTHIPDSDFFSLCARARAYQSARDLSQISDLQAQLEEATKEKQEIQEKVKRSIQKQHSSLPGTCPLPQHFFLIRLQLFTVFSDYFDQKCFFYVVAFFLLKKALQFTCKQQKSEKVSRSKFSPSEFLQYLKEGWCT